MAEQKELLGRYCHLLLADYVVWAAAAAAAPMADQAGGGPEGAAAAAALRRGAHALFGAVGAAELQHVHAVVGQGPVGQTRRGALAELRASYEREFKYTGKT
jgi:hypothetical protein